jgi:hypothetical protein
MEIGRRTLFRTCEITWAARRFAVQGHPERAALFWYIPINTRTEVGRADRPDPD